jgi:hypothetical protein
MTMGTKLCDNIGTFLGTELAKIALLHIDKISMNLGVEELRK